MAERVFILGAGASFHAGAPLMNNFLDKAENLLENDRFGEFTPNIKKVFDAISELGTISTKANIGVNSNFEDFFGVIDMAQITNRFGAYDKDQILELRECLEIMIVKTIELTTQFKLNNSGRPVSTSIYQKFVDAIKQFDDFSIITFNYDIALDLALYNGGVWYSYGYKDIDESMNPHTQLLKLHGSTNYGICSECKEIIEYPIGKYLNSHTFMRSGNQKSIMAISSALRKLKEQHIHENSYSIKPLIVPPTWTKSQSQVYLQKVWARAIDELGSARYIYVIGYSLPKTDVFFNYLYGLGTMNPRQRLRKFAVVDIDDTGEIKERYLDLLSLEMRNKFDYFEDTFASFLQKNIIE